MVIGFEKTYIKKNQIEDKFFKYSLDGNKIKFYLNNFYDGYRIIENRIEEIELLPIEDEIIRIDLIYIKEDDSSIEVLYGTEDNIEPDYEFKNVILKIIRTGPVNYIKKSDIIYFIDNKYVKTNLYKEIEDNYLEETDITLTELGV